MSNAYSEVAHVGTEQGMVWYVVKGRCMISAMEVSCSSFPTRAVANMLFSAPSVD